MTGRVCLEEAGHRWLGTVLDHRKAQGHTMIRIKWDARGVGTFVEERLPRGMRPATAADERAGRR